MPEKSRQKISGWSHSSAKRVFDASCVLLALPVLAPLALVVVIAIYLTSPGPVLFRQVRVGRHGRLFTILKFRTMLPLASSPHHPVAALDDRRPTRVGPLLRRWKLDELPQLVNVLVGQMSLVGPRPKMPEHAVFQLPCRPGLTGMATLAFADEEAMLSGVRRDELEAFIYNVVLPTKHKMDSDYLERATFRSDLDILVKSVFRRPVSTEVALPTPSGLPPEANRQRRIMANRPAPRTLPI